LAVPDILIGCDCAPVALAHLLLVFASKVEQETAGSRLHLVELSVDLDPLGAILYQAPTAWRLCDNG